ncbi:MAG TPA: hypothetical protein VKD72_20890 [Gemmataceae bacterium]|nr:hypothetical protein [Gemmataceae bacterium]
MKRKIGQNDALAEAERELARLRAEVESLKVGKLPGVTATGPPGIYRVSLPGLRPILSEVIVRPRYPQGFIPRIVGPGAVVPENYRTLPEASYDGWALFLATGNPDLQAAGKEKYRVEKGLKPEEMIWVRVRTEKRKQVDYLDIPAQSPADALHLFYRFCGVKATERIPVVDPVPVEGNGHDDKTPAQAHAHAG